jgi:hypothetical protein
VTIRTERNGATIRWRDADSEAVRALGLDVLIMPEGGEIEGPIRGAARFGIWSVLHADDRQQRQASPGFRESARGAPVTGATLLMRTAGSHPAEAIGSCWQNTHANALLNERFITHLSVSLVMRELRRLDRERAPPPCVPVTASAPAAPGVGELLGYLARRGAGVGSYLLRQARKLRGRPMMWALGLGHGPIETADLSRTIEVMPTAGHFWADPFLFEHRGELYVFFEELGYRQRRGWISVGKVVGDRVEYLGVAIDAGYHMSYPFVYAHDGEIYMIPEASANKRVEIWQAVEFPLRWRLHHTVLDGTDVADSVIVEHQGAWWLLANISQTPHKDLCNELHVFAIDGPELRSLTPHPGNPVVIDSRTARNGGRPFVRDGRLFRPSQNNSHGVYGYGLNLMEVTTLSLAGYAEQPRVVFTPGFKPGIAAVHHVDAVGDRFVVDYCRAFEPS